LGKEVLGKKYAMLNEAHNIGLRSGSFGGSADPFGLEERIKERGGEFWRGRPQFEGERIVFVRGNQTERFLNWYGEEGDDRT